MEDLSTSLHNAGYKISAPAGRALEAAGVRDLASLAAWTHHDLANLHGMGPNALKVLDALLALHGMDWAASAASADVEGYLEGFSGVVRERLDAVRALVREIMPQALERMAYAMPSYSFGENVVHFAAFTKHLGLYATPSAHEAFRSRLAGLVSSKGAVQFPHDQVLPLDLIRDLLTWRWTEIRTSEVYRYRRSSS